MPLNMDIFRELPDTVTKSVKVKEWGKTVYLKVMSSEEALKFDAARDQLKNDHALLLAFTLCDETGQGAEDPVAFYEVVGKRNSVVLRRLFKIALKLNELDGASEDERKNECATPDTGSSSSLPQEGSEDVPPTS